MATKTIKCASINEGYQKLIREFQNNSAISKGRQQGCIHELLDMELELEDPRKSVLSLPMRNMSRRYASGEFLLYMKGSNKLEDFKFYSKTWERLANPDGTINSAYGHRWFANRAKKDGDTDEPTNRFNFALQQLLENPDTKNAVIMLRDDDDIKDDVKDRCCTLALCFSIRDGKLNLRTIMRSQDFWTGLPYDIFCFTRLQQIMLYLYNSRRDSLFLPEIELGTYTHQVLNLHVYEKHWDRVCGYVPIRLNTKEAYQFPEYTSKSETDLTKLMLWEDRLRTDPETPIETHAYNLRELKLDPFCETLGSYLVNNIKNYVPTSMEKDLFIKAEEESKKSVCIDRKVGCVITTKDGDIIGQGCNTVINCNKNCHDKIHRICNVRHAEVSAIQSINENVKALAEVAYVTLYPCFPCMQELEKQGLTVKVKGFSHKGATGNVMLYDPEFF